MKYIITLMLLISLFGCGQADNNNTTGNTPATVNPSGSSVTGFNLLNNMFATQFSADNYTINQDWGLYKLANISSPGSFPASDLAQYEIIFGAGLNNYTTRMENNILSTVNTYSITPNDIQTLISQYFTKWIDYRNSEMAYIFSNYNPASVRSTSNNLSALITNDFSLLRLRLTVAGVI